MNIPRVWRTAPVLLAVFSICAHAAVEPANPLAFADFYKRPIGPRGLEPGPRLLALEGSRVELVGYIAQAHDSAAQPSILAPVPVSLDDEDESLADDLPAALAYLRPADSAVAAALLACHGPVRVAGRLALGRQAEADGRASFVRLLADEVQCVR